MWLELCFIGSSDSLNTESSFNQSAKSLVLHHFPIGQSMFYIKIWLASDPFER